MTNETLEEKTNSRLWSIKVLMENANELGRENYDKDGAGIKAIYSQNQALYKQNQIIIDYLQTLYQELKK